MSLFLPVSFLLFLSGCGARRVNIKTTTFSDSNVIPNGFEKKKSFCITGGSYVEGVKQNNDELETKELKKKISLMLENRDFVVTESNSADYFLLFNYGCKSDTISYNALHYIPGTTYTSNATYSGSRGYYGQCNATTTSSGSYIYLPTQQTFFTKFLCFYIYNKEGQQQMLKDNTIPSQHIWYGLSVGVDGYADLRYYLDFLLLSMFNSFGKSGTVNDVIAEDDESMISLREQIAGKIIKPDQLK